MQTAGMVKPQDIVVLLVEDSSGDAAAITKAMVYGSPFYNFKITRKATLEGGMEFLHKNKVDVILLDLDLPDAKELEAINDVHTQFKDLPIVVISGYSDINMVHEALHCGAQEFLIKGECSGVTIRQSIYQAIARKQIETSYNKDKKT